MTHDADTQRRYYADTAARYDTMHLHERDEHFLALSMLVGVIGYLGVRSILDVGSGTGRALEYLKAARPDIRVVGIEPVGELREVGHAKGLSPDELRDGNATNLAYADGAFDLVCEFGVLHHIRNPERAVAEMLRVARRAVFVSDSNNFGQGSAAVRLLKQLLDSCGLWPLADYVKTRGRGYTISGGDGLAYSYSVFNNYEQIRRACRSVHVMNTRDGTINPYRTASHVALLGIKPDDTAAA